MYKLNREKGKNIFKRCVTLKKYLRISKMLENDFIQSQKILERPRSA